MKKLVIFKDKDKNTVAMSITTAAGEFYSSSYELDNTACAKCFNSLTERAGLDLCIDAEDSIDFEEFICIIALEYIAHFIIRTHSTVEVIFIQKGDGSSYPEELSNDLIYYNEEF